jgi:hypothetical protein
MLLWSIAHIGENVGYCYPSGLEKTLCKWDICDVPLVTKGLTVSCKPKPCLRLFYFKAVLPIYTNSQFLRSHFVRFNAFWLIYFPFI